MFQFHKLLVQKMENVCKLKVEETLTVHKKFQEINQWNWSVIIAALKQCPCSSSSENFSSQLFSDTSSTCSTTTRISSSTPWWFEELVFFDVRLIDKLVKIMLFHKLDQSIIFKFLIFYLKSKLSISASAQAERRKIVEVVIDLLTLLDRNSISCKGLFEIHRIFSRLKGRSKCCRLKLERLIGSKLDQATIDQLLINPSRKCYAYDVNLVLRLVEAYILERWMLFPDRIKNVGNLIDSYLIEVAADFRLTPSKFTALTMVLPDSARESNDKLYQAIDLYLQVHTRLREEETIRLCCALNHEKLSPEALKHLVQNSKFPGRKAVQSFVVYLKQSGLKNKNVRSRKKDANHIIGLPTICNSSTKSRYLPKFCK